MLLKEKSLVYAWVLLIARTARLVWFLQDRAEFSRAENNCTSRALRCMKSHYNPNITMDPRHWTPPSEAMAESSGSLLYIRAYTYTL